MDWATKRKLQYLGIIFGATILFVVLPFFIFIYKSPTCFDGVKNGDELGVDCGGTCRLLCSAQIAEPLSRWDPRIFRVAPGVYSVLAYLENPNAAAEVLEAPYVFKLYDSNNILISEKSGKTFIPRGQNFAVFEPNINTGERVPTRAVFEFPQPLVWVRNTDTAPDLVVSNKALVGTSTSPRIEASVRNNSLDSIKNIDLTVIVFDGAGNAVGASRTYIEEIAPSENKRVVFTWPAPFETDSEVCSTPVDVVLALDRSGSMASLGSNPPQPLTDVKNAAIFFTNQLGSNDQASLVTFATKASIDENSFLTSEISKIKEAINDVEILSDGIQQTNIAEAVQLSLNELLSFRERAEAPGVIVLLTDGVATVPASPGDPTYAEGAALFAGGEAKSQDVRLFTIGLGKDVNSNFLRELASSPEDFYPAPTSNELTSVYSQIATKICQKKPVSIEIIPRIFPGSIPF